MSTIYPQYRYPTIFHINHRIQKSTVPTDAQQQFNLLFYQGTSAETIQKFRFVTVVSTQQRSEFFFTHHPHSFPLQSFDQTFQVRKKFRFYTSAINRYGHKSILLHSTDKDRKKLLSY